MDRLERQRQNNSIKQQEQREVLGEPALLGPSQPASPCLRQDHCYTLIRHLELPL